MKELLIPLGKVGEVQDAGNLSDDRTGDVYSLEDSPQMCVADPYEVRKLNECYSSPLGFFLYNTSYDAGWHGREYYSSFDTFVKTQKYHSIPTVAKWETLPKCNAVSIGQRLRLLRKELGLTQEEFGQRIGKGVATIKRWESGQTEPNDKTLRLISHTFGVSYEWLKEGKGEMWERERFPTTEEELMEWVVREVIKFLRGRGVAPTHKKVYRLSEIVYKRIKPLWEEEREKIESKEIFKELERSYELYKSVEE